MPEYLKEKLKQQDLIYNLDNEEKEYLGVVKLANSLNNYFKYYGNNNMLKTLLGNLLNEKEVSHWEDSNFNRERYILSFLYKFDYPYSRSFDAPATVAYDDDHAFKVFLNIKELKETNNIS